MANKCKVSGCSAHSWYNGMCSFHSLQAFRQNQAIRVSEAGDIAQGKKKIRSRAKDLGITIDDCVAHEHTTKASNSSRVRSPVG